MATRKQVTRQITPPFGYGEVVPLQKDHRVALPALGATPEFCRSINALALSIAEFSAAARDYPIVFASADAGASYSPVAVLGLADGQNLFVDASGAWDSTAYLPAFVRRYPFCIAALRTQDGEQAEKLVCVESGRLDRRGTPLFDAGGEPSPQWLAAQRLLQEYQNDLEATARMCAALGELDLLSPFTFQVMQGEAPGLRLQGMYRIDEHKLEALKPEKHKALVSGGLMGKIYAHIHSLENFARLYQRAVARARAPVKAKRKKKPVSK
jgi:hypothetical protein